MDLTCPVFFNFDGSCIQLLCFYSGKLRAKVLFAGAFRVAKYREFGEAWGLPVATWLPTYQGSQVVTHSGGQYDLVTGRQGCRVSNMGVS